MCLQAILLREGPVSHPVSPPFPCSSQVITDHVVLMAHPPFSGGGVREEFRLQPHRSPPETLKIVGIGFYTVVMGKGHFLLNCRKKPSGHFLPSSFICQRFPPRVLVCVAHRGYRKGRSGELTKPGQPQGFHPRGPASRNSPPPRGGYCRFACPENSSLGTIWTRSPGGKSEYFFFKMHFSNPFSLSGL